MHIRAFEHDERLLGLAFLDVSIYVTSIRTLKNLLLIGDVEKSVWFAVFQVRRRLSLSSLLSFLVSLDLDAIFFSSLRT